MFSENLANDFVARTKLIGYAKTDMGLGQGLRMAAKALLAANIPTSVYSISAAEFNDSNQSVDHLIDNADFSHDINMIHINADQTVDLSSRIPLELLKNKYNIGNWAWELSHFPEQWYPAFDYLDEIWVSSLFIKEAVSVCTNKPVHVIPYVINTEINPLPNRPAFGLHPDTFYFLVTMDLNSFIERKNPFAAIEAFQKAFPEKNKANVGLVIKLHGKAAFKAQRDNLKLAVGDDQRIIVIDKNLRRDENESLQASCDCYVSLHRSEGFGLNIAENMSLGKPVIATAYSGNMDFMSDKDALLVDYKLIPVQDGQYPCWENQQWASPSIENAIAHMRFLVDNPDQRKIIGDRAKTRICSQLSPAVVGKSILKRLYDICNAHR